MTAIHNFKCDSCKKTVQATYNGEHWLPPADWVQLFDAMNCRANGQHLCGDCLPKAEQDKRPKKRGGK